MTHTTAPDRTRAAPPLMRAVVLTLMALVVGFAAALAAIGFVEGVSWLNHALLISPRARVQLEGNPGLVTAATVLVPTLGGLIVGVMLSRFSPEGRALGPPDVVRAVQLRAPLPSTRGGAVSSLAALVSLGFGASVGQYGPMVYLGAMIGGWVERLRLGVPNLPAIAVACGVAAAISTAFNAPIAGLVFAHEVILRHYSMQAFAPATVASATGYVVANVMFERPPLFLVDFGGVAHGYEFLLFALLGLASAGVALIFMRLVLASAVQAARLPLPPALRPALAGLAVGVTALALPDVLGIGSEALRFATIEGAFRPGELVVLVAAKIVLTALCVGFGFAGGVFSPALLIGILFGALSWSLLDTAGIADTSGVAVYAVCAMMAVTSPVIGAPLTTILIVFELTRNYDLTIAAMVAVVFSNLIAYRVFGRSIFDVQLARRGVDLSAGRDRARLEAMTVAEWMSTDFPSATAEMPADEAQRTGAASPYAEVFVTDAEGQLVGVLRAGRPGAGSAADAAESAPVTFHADTTIWQAMQELGSFIGDAVPVVSRDNGRLEGVISEAALIRAYLAAMQDLRGEENAPV
ncbi:chloride ion channel [Maritimibacter sp. 55A14]|uniref:chloride channel protein n=1 Tax=Maritimibacter sp. 55A14 TaxID=2174844 RepID=UPI000D611855|nr:chloride channel protein [Maritimibacter sp. 55A14]PWE31167.1 chloride ion channel [Maritimibacter sp. 55A14]